MKTSDYVEYMVFPRMLAMAEVVWSPKEAREWDGFVRRVDGQLNWLDHLAVNYRVPHVRGLESDIITLEDRVAVDLTTLLPSAQIRYTTDGTEPGPSALLYAGTLELPVDEEGVTVTARAFLASGRTSTPRAAHFKKTTLRPAENLTSTDIQPGIQFRYYEAEVGSVMELFDLAPTQVGVSARIGIGNAQRREQIGLWFEGYFEAPESGVYIFHLGSDDGSGLTIGGQTVIDNDGLHGFDWNSGMIALEQGYHPLTLLYFQAGGGMALQLKVQRPGQESRVDLDDWLFHQP